MKWQGIARGVVGVAMVGALSSETVGQSTDTVRLAEIQVIGSRSNLGRMAGAASVVAIEALRPWRAATANDVLRQVPGVTIREEEGLGLRPNIGVRGLSPTRSSKVLLLEDGIPLSFAPYGDNASYYHPPISRFERVEVVRGSGQILFGPHTVGGVINYITPNIPRQLSGSLQFTAGTQEYVDLVGRAGGQIGRTGVLVSYARRQAEGSREHVSTALDDGMLKLRTTLSERQTVTIRANAYRERSNVTYSGLTEEEWAQDPRQNPFRNDSMKLNRWGASASHQWTQSEAVQLITTLYASGVSRDWWRQSSNSAERPNDRSDPACGGMQNLHTTCGNQGRLRDYLVMGIEPRLRAAYRLLGHQATVDAGVRWHGELQNRRQVNGATPLAREAGPSSNRNAGLVEDNERTNQALSAFFQQQLLVGPWAFTPGLRLERIDYARANRLAEPDVTGTTTLSQLVPGAGVAYRTASGATLFAGVHRGFSPPRTEDVIDNDTGGPVELGAELSWNFELGGRARIGPATFEVTAFRLDFANQIVPASVAGGTGAALTNAGQTLHEGVEAGTRVEDRGLGNGGSGWYVEGALTWLPVARFEGERFGYVGTGGSDVVGKVYAAQNATASRRVVDVSGKRLPYAPRETYTIALGYQRPTGLDLRIEANGVGRQYSDPTNTDVTVADGQQGVLPAYRIWHVSAAYPLRSPGSLLFVTVRNVTDALYLADRTRGMVPGARRLIHLGVTQAF